ncbi:MAG: toprim domain-containing protein [Firmicutes bacterium]|nr:toprim domain-containing protein [Bacillota bacterium]
MIEQARIAQAKQQSLIETIESKGIAVKKQGGQYFALCPFHEDHIPSLSIDPKTNLFKCFGCGAAGDTIKFIELYDKKSFPEAVGALTEADSSGKPDVTEPGMNSTQLLNRIASFYHDTFLTNPNAQRYLASRGITKPEIYQSFKIGYADGKLLSTLPKEGGLVDALKKTGILTRYGKELFLNCVIVPLFDSGGNVAGMYGRKVSNGQVNHLYLPGKRHGIVNRPAAASSEAVILTESIIDALSLYQNGYPNVIPLYGTNGLTDDHLELFHAYRPKKIYLCLNSDDPGKKATVQIGEVLTGLGFNIGVIRLPGHKDVNEFFQAGKTFDDFTKLLIEAENSGLKPGYSVEESEIGLIINCRERQYRIRLASMQSLERLRVNIRATCGEKYHIDTIDLYQSRSRHYLTGQLAKLFNLEAAAIDSDLLFIINQIEAHQAKSKIEADTAKKPYQMTKEEEAEALKLLTDSNLLELILADMEAIGHVGEETNKILAYLISVSRKLPKPLSGIIISQAAAGKSGLVETVQELTPPEEVEFFSRITPQALYYMERDALKRKLLIIEERTGGEGADYSIRTLQSRRKLTQAVPIKDPNTGKIKTMTFEVEGPIAYLETTTSAEINHENATRCFELYLDESPEQTRRIHQAQRTAKTGEGLARKARIEAIKRRHHNLQRMLKEAVVEIPYAPLLDFPADSLRTRRDHERFLSLIEAVTFLFQYQREQREIATPEGEKMTAVLATLEDYARAYELAREILGFTLDDLKKHSRELLESIQAMIGPQSKGTEKPPEEILFTRRDIREYLGWPDHQIKAYIKQLEEMEYLVVENLKSRGQFAYRLNNPNKRKPLKGLLTPEELAKHLEGFGLTGTTGRKADSTSQIHE